MVEKELGSLSPRLGQPATSSEQGIGLLNFCSTTGPGLDVAVCGSPSQVLQAALGFSVWQQQDTREDGVLSPPASKQDRQQDGFSGSSPEKQETQEECQACPRGHLTLGAFQTSCLPSI